MIVASLDISVPEVARELLKHGLDPTVRVNNLHTEHGYGTAESPLDWARRLGDTPVAQILAEFGNKSAPRSKPPADVEPPKLRAESPSASIQKALPLLYEGGREFFKRSGCTSCHHNMLPAVAFSVARAKGISLDEEKVRRNSQQSVAWLKGSEQALLQDVPFGGGALTAAYLLWGLAADGHSRDRATDAAVLHLTGSQTTEGLWRTLPFRPPLESSSFTATAIAVKAVQSYMIPQRTTEFQKRIRAAAKWLAATSPRSGEERSMRVLGLAWAATEPRALRTAADHLLSVQRADGGWAQLDSLTSDAYATGQALYALDVAGRLNGQVLEKGIRFLLDAQLADGSWHVQSRSYPVQSNYFETGFPHGRDQWISAAATSWACIGLSLAVKP
jgi:N-acyl-D-amino-acid deacylase